MTLALVVVILAVVNIVLSILDRNWAALIGWSAGTLGFLNCYLMALSRRRAIPHRNTNLNGRCSHLR